MPKRVLSERVQYGRDRMAIGPSIRNRQKGEVYKLGGVWISIFGNEIEIRLFGNVGMWGT